MGLAGRKAVVMANHPLQTAVVKRRLQLRAVSMWINDSMDGKPGTSLRAYCRQVAEERGSNPEWLYRGITKVMREPKVQGMIQGVLDEMASRGIKTGTSVLLKRIEEHGEGMESKEVIAIVENMAKIKGKAFERKEGEGGTTVAVQVNLPAMAGYDAPLRVEAVARAKDVLGDLVR